MAGNGGPRPGAGRPAGSKNKTPSRAAQAQVTFAEMILPKLQDLFNTLYGIAMDTSAKDSDRINAVEVLLNRAMGKPTETIVSLDASSDLQVDGTTASELMGIWDSVEVPPEESDEQPGASA